MAITTTTDICNISQRHLRQNPISDISDPKSKSELTYAQVFDAIRRATLEAHPWNFALKRAQVGQSNVNPSHGWNYASAPLPSDYIRMAAVGERDDWTPYQFALEGNQILSNDLAPYFILYVSDFTNVSRMSPLFIQALGLHLAATVAYDITGNSALGDSLMAKYDEFLTQAMGSDGAQRPPIRMERSRWNRSRRRGGSSRSRDGMYLGDLSGS